MLDHHTALIYTMVLVSAADGRMSDAELRTIGEVVNYLPIFDDYESKNLPVVAGDCAEILDDKDGLARVLEVIVGLLPEYLRETAYAIGCDVAAADGSVKPEEVRLLEMLGDTLHIDPLAAAAIERGARARHMVL
ncbi:MAG: tellurite resistance TerB family protein [Alphaproteobacteria bacterium]|nr:tellurite resistance TerB family protein [Alphaproteobacteria bacterium]